MTRNVLTSKQAMSEQEQQFNIKSDAAEATKTELKEPDMFKVILLNDDFTPMDFVIEVLQRFFQMDEQRATKVMLHVHIRGKGLCGIFTHEIAETKSVQVNNYSREHEHPLLCVMEVV